MNSPQCVKLTNVVSNLGDKKTCLQQCVNLTPNYSCWLVLIPTNIMRHIYYAQYCIGRTLPQLSEQYRT